MTLSIAVWALAGMTVGSLLGTAFAWAVWAAYLKWFR